MKDKCTSEAVWKTDLSLALQKRDYAVARYNSLLQTTLILVPTALVVGIIIGFLL